MLIDFQDKELIERAGWKVWKQGKEQSRIFTDLKVSGRIISGLLKEGRKKTRTVVKEVDGDLIPQCSCPEFYATHSFCSHTVALLLQGREAKSNDTVNQEANSVEGKPKLHISAEFTAPLHEVAPQKNFSLKVTIEEKEGNGAALIPMLSALQIPAVQGQHLAQLNQESLIDLLKLHAQAPFIENVVGNTSAARFPLVFERVGDALTLQVPVLEEWQCHRIGDFILLIHKGSSAYYLQEVKELSEEGIDLLQSSEVNITLHKYFTIVSILGNWFDLSKVDSHLQSLLFVEKPRFSIHLEGTVKRVTAKVTVNYGMDLEFALSADANRSFQFLKYEAGRIHITNIEQEQKALEHLMKAGFIRCGDEFVLEGEGDILEYLAYTNPILMSEEWVITMMGSFRALVYNTILLSLHLQIDPYSNKDEFASVQYSFETPEGKGMKSTDAQRLMQSGQQSFKLKEGRVALLSRKEFELISEAIRDCEANQSVGKYLIPTDEVQYLLELGIPIKGDFKPPAEVAPEINGNTLSCYDMLRDYQKDGVQWLLSRLQNHHCALLADDMGLGKTIQTIAVIEALAMNAQTLIVCPASLIPNWKAELAKWLPSYNSEHLHIMSYQKYLRDAEVQKNITYELCILDEASMIKNPETKLSRALYEQPARYKIALTGTPLENTAGDLWSIFRFLSPRYLGKKAQFRERFVKPLEKAGYTAELTSKRLRAKLNPMVLRRTKQNVLTELPPKTYRIDYCVPNAEQIKEFDRIRKEYEELKERDDVTQIQILTSILRMRQVANDPQLLSNNFTQYAPKVNRLLQILEQAKALNKKVLVFSQFAQMLDILQEQLQEHGHLCSKLIGSTRDREQQIQNFRETNNVFLISLKAGGYGLNLTEASIVVHFDPWWNPAVENQATDRAYRMGQSEPVTVIKLITENSIDERILKLQQQKQSLYSTTIDESTQNTVGITSSELKELLVGS